MTEVYVNPEGVTVIPEGLKITGYAVKTEESKSTDPVKHDRRKEDKLEIC